MHRPLVIWLIFAAALLSSGTGCRHLSPDPPQQVVVDEEPSWDGNEQNSGVLDVYPEGGFVVTAHFIERYNSLIRIHGNRFQPPLRRNRGVLTHPNGIDFIIDNQHMVFFLDMNLWDKSDIPVEK